MMSSRIARVVTILIPLATAILLAISAMPVCRTGLAHATYQESAASITPTISTDNQTNQETANEKLYPGVAERLSTLKPTDDIWLEVKFIIYEAIGPMGKVIRKMTLEEHTRIAVAIETLPDTNIIGDRQNGLLLQTKVEDIEALTEMPEIAGITGISSSNQKLYPGVAERLSTLKPTDDIWLEVKFIIYEAITPMGKIIREMTPEARTRVAAAIEALPDTRIIGGTENGMLVQTKVGNIEALTEMPEIAGITGISSIGPPMSSHPPIQLLSPNNTSLDCPVDQPSFSWSPHWSSGEKTTRYRFVLAKDAAMTQVVKEAEVTDKSYDYDGTLDYGTNYFWRVMALEPAPSDWSATFSFRTEAAPPPAAEAEPQTITWPMALTALIIIALAISSGAAIWLIISKRQKSKG
jgi:hypothetical protein